MSTKLFKHYSYIFLTFLVICLVTQLCPTLCDPMDCNLLGSSVHGDFPGKNTGVGCHALLQRLFPTQGSNPSPLHCRQILYHLSHQGCLLLVKGMPICYYYVEIEVQVPIYTFVDIERAWILISVWWWWEFSLTTWYPLTAMRLIALWWESGLSTRHKICGRLFMFLYLGELSHCRGCFTCPSSTTASHHPRIRDQLVPW